MGLKTSVSGCLVGALAFTMAGCGRTSATAIELPTSRLAAMAASRPTGVPAGSQAVDPSAPLVAAAGGAASVAAKLPAVAAGEAIARAENEGAAAPGAAGALPAAASAQVAPGAVPGALPGAVPDAGASAVPVAVPVAASDVAAGAPNPGAPVAAGAPVAPAATREAPSAGPALGTPVEMEAPVLALVDGLLAAGGAKPLFDEQFADGLSAWTTRGLVGAGAAEDGVALATGKARRSLWLKTREAIDLADAASPHLKLAFQGAPATLTAVWETEAGDYPEEILLAPTEDGAAFDLTALRNRPGHLVLVAKAPKGAAPVLDGVTIYDAAEAR